MPSELPLTSRYPRLLITDHLGLERTGSIGEAVGTVCYFVAIPGGDLVMARVDAPDGARRAVFLELMAVESADGKAIRATQAAAHLTGSRKLVDLASQLSD
ncbi:hypothetical protein [Limimaricola soesokkakensis]|uniref:hypothetical protein n=1 Tax=Limimaricola soesokkakensis TaxID=1343159 RepID=UPI0040589D49